MHRNLTAAIYGTLIIGALLAAESAEHETYSETVVAVLITLLLYWLAHSYAEFTSRRLQEGRPIRIGDLVRTMGLELPVVIGAAVPLLALLIEWALDVKLTTAVTVAVWVSVVTIVVTEIVAGLRARQSGRDLAFQATLGALLGFLIIVLKRVLH